MSQTPAAHDYGLLLLFLYQRKKIIDLLIVICKQASTDTYYIFCACTCW